MGSKPARSALLQVLASVPAAASALNDGSITLGSNDPFLPPGWFWLVFITATEAYQAGQAGGTGLTGRHCENTCVF